RKMGLRNEGLHQMGMPGCMTRSQQNFQTSGCSIIMREERLPCLAMCKGTAKRPQTERPERATVGKFIKHRRVSWIIGGDPGHPVQRQTRRVGGGLHMRPSVRSRVEVDTKTSYP
ncbi:hypothetical protein, partial [Roseovarius sp. SYSU LYC5161]|uniref:hypothetical protein n=1 Tax=Roseovarius halophilus (ex Wu et al. 2025) TaxID=3376060 RepID=UPI0039996328